VIRKLALVDEELPGGIASFESFSRAIAKFLEAIQRKAP
jgi:hypothetical protein